MKIFFDESGQSGCVLQKEDILNFQNQPTFAIGAIVVFDNNDEKELIDKYSKFKTKFNIENEIKGSDLLTRAKNKELEYIVKRIFDKNHFFVILYDKRFYISTLLLLSLMGFEYQYSMPVHFYQQAAFLSLQKDSFFVEYLKYIQNPNAIAFTKYLNYLVNYEYMYDEGFENAVVFTAQKILDQGLPNECYDDFLSFGWYDDPKITNLINLTALVELIHFVKSQKREKNNEIIYIHDHIDEFEETFHNELQRLGIDIKFLDSKQEILLQLADNLVSILRHAYDKCIYHHKNNDPWSDKNEWDMKLISKVIYKITIPHINFTVPLHDWSATLSTAEMFVPYYPKKYRNNLNFNFHYQANMIKIFESISMNSCSLKEIYELLEI